MGTSDSMISHCIPLSYCQLLLALAVCVLVIVDGAVVGRRFHLMEHQRNVSIKNESGVRVDIFWIHRQGNQVVDYVSNSENGQGYPYGGEAPILSYIGHEFQIREMPSKITGKCKYETCRTAYMKVSRYEDQEVVIDRDFRVTHTDNRHQAMSEAAALMEACRSKGGDNTLESMASCMETQLDQRMQSKEEELAFESSLRQEMGQQLIPYFCQDDPDIPKGIASWNVSQEVYNKTFTFSEYKGAYPSNVKFRVVHERPDASLIAYSDALVSPSECRSLQSLLLVANGTSSIPVSSLTEGKLSGPVLRGQSLMEKLDQVWDFLIPQADKATWKTAAGEHDTLFSFLGQDNPIPDGGTTTKGRWSESDRLAGTAFIFCPPATIDDENENNDAALFFPSAGVYVPSKANRLVVAIRSPKDAQDGEGFLEEWHACLKAPVFVHERAA